MATTTNFGWETPDDTDLVKDGALAMRTLGNAIDASLVDLKGGTTGQVLSKNSNTDMDFTWVTTDDADAIQNSIVDAKGDLITATADNTPARLAVGNNGETLVADSSASTGLRWQADWNTGKNKIINGDFNINQRGFTSGTTQGQYIVDRFQDDGTGGTITSSVQSFTAGAAPVAGYEAKQFIRLVTATQSAAGHYMSLTQAIEDVRTLAGQTATVSFWAKAASGTPNIGVTLLQSFGSGGSSSVINSAAVQTITTSWARYSFQITVPSISGKTIGANSFLKLFIFTSVGSTISGLGYPAVGLQNGTFDIWGVQVEAGSVATPFTTATGTLAGELAACQRYYWRANATTNYTPFANGQVYGTSNAIVNIQNPVVMRVSPTALEYSNLMVTQYNSTAQALTSLTLGAANPFMSSLTVVTSAATLTTGNATWLAANNTTNAYIALTAEL